MSRRLSVTLPDEVMEKIEALARASAKSKSEVVRDLIADADLSARMKRERRADVRRRSNAFRARQDRGIDAAALAREAREELEERSDRLDSDSDQ